MESDNFHHRANSNIDQFNKFEYTPEAVFNTFLCLLVITIFSLCVAWFLTRPRWNYPPGPSAIRGNIAFMRASMNGTLHDVSVQWAEQFGDLTYVSCFGTRLLILNTPRVVRKMFGSEEYKYKVADRKELGATKIAFAGGKDFVFTKFDDMQDKKRQLFCELMETCGDGTPRFTNLVQRETDKFLKTLGQHQHEDYNMIQLVNDTHVSILHILLLGQPQGDITMPYALEDFDAVFNKLTEPENDYNLTHSPLLSKISNKLMPFVQALKWRRREAYHLLYETPQETLNPECPRGIADMLLELAKKPEFNWLAEDSDHMLSFMLCIFHEAHRPTKTLLLGAILSLINYPDIAKKIQKEIDDVLGDRRPTVEDMPNMPYTVATIMELLRLITVVPLSGVRHIEDFLTFEGMVIPGGTTIYVNQWFIHHNERLWPDPWTLRPERFLTDDGQLMPPEDRVWRNLKPWGEGVRRCPGELFAKNRVFLLMTSILQKFHLLPPVDEELTPADFHILEIIQGSVRKIEQFTCRVRRRVKIDSN